MVCKMSANLLFRCSIHQSTVLIFDGDVLDDGDKDEDVTNHHGAERLHRLHEHVML